MMIRFVKEIQGTRESDNYATPKGLLHQLNEEFHFDYDPCPLRSTVNGLIEKWLGNIYVNPPYSNIAPFLEKGLEELSAGHAERIVYLLPVRTDTRYWHEQIINKASEIRLIKGRLHFNDLKTPAPFPCALVVFDQKLNGVGNLTSFIQSVKTKNLIN